MDRVWISSLKQQSTRGTLSTANHWSTFLNVARFVKWCACEIVMAPDC